MTRPIAILPNHPRLPRVRRGYTLIEILVATGLMAVILVSLTAMLARVTEAIRENRAALEMAERLRGASHRLAQDLEGITATTLPPRDPGSSEGMLVVTEGPIGPIILLKDVAFNLNMNATPDSSAGDTDDILHFTTRSSGEPFVGRAGTGVIESDVAEVIWFVRGNTLYRRQLIVLPSFAVDLLDPAGFYNDFDLSVHWDDVKATLAANSLGDLTKPENRFGYNPANFPHHPHLAVNGDWRLLRMPTLQECSHPSWLAGALLPVTLDLTNAGIFDPWLNPYVYTEQNEFTGTLTALQGLRVGEDVVLTNVLSFDVKVWDPDAPLVLHVPTDTTLVPGDLGYLDVLNSGGTVVGYGAYVDLNYMANAPPAAPRSRFAGPSHPGIPSSVYDTWSTHYEHDGIDQNNNSIADEGANGFDDGAGIAGIVDDPDEAEAPAPYPHPLRGIQIKIRVFEPDSRVVREVTIVQDLQTK